jgi:outer membrane protein assembly factor BamE (lipoprotein component of BamABCDE complex)
MRHLIAIALLCTPPALLAQSENTISPGMTRAQVESALGAPATLRTVSEFSYLFYANTCGRSCGMNDLVILHRDSVVDAIFRSPNRHYTGQSSSPQEARPQVSARKAAPASKPLTVRKDASSSTTKPATGTMKPHAEANDARPSIPLNPPTVKPGANVTPSKAPAKKPAPGAAQ